MRGQVKGSGKDLSRGQVPHHCIVDCLAIRMPGTGCLLSFALPIFPAERLPDGASVPARIADSLEVGSFHTVGTNVGKQFFAADDGSGCLFVGPSVAVCSRSSAGFMQA